jgi:hypothetical protein
MVLGHVLARIIEYCEFLDQNFEKKDSDAIMAAFDCQFTRALSVEQTTQIVVVINKKSLFHIHKKTCHNLKFL